MVTAAEETKPKEEVKPAAEAAAPETPTSESVLAKVQAGTTLTEAETELFKSIPKDHLPAPGAQAQKKEEAKPKEEAAAATDPTEERRKLIEAEVNKPRSQQDLKKFTPAELSIFWDLKKARRKNQVLEDELEIARVENIVNGLKNKGKEEAAPAAAVEEDPLKFLEGRADDDILTVAEAKKIANALKQKPKEEAKPAHKQLRTPDQIRLERVEAGQALQAQGITDFNEVIDHAKLALEGDEEATGILRDVATQGGNVVEETYWLIKGSKKWPEVEKLIKSIKDSAQPRDPKTGAFISKENQDRAKKLVENEEKIKTTGPAGGAPANSKEFTMAEIQGMTHKEIRALPKATRQAILEKYGSEPNLNI